MITHTHARPVAAAVSALLLGAALVACSSQGTDTTTPPGSPTAADPALPGDCDICGVAWSMNGYDSPTAWTDYPHLLDVSPDGTFTWVAGATDDTEWGDDAGSGTWRRDGDTYVLTFVDEPESGLSTLSVALSDVGLAMTDASGLTYVPVARD